MHNPLVLFTTALLESFIENGHKYFVRQTYKRGIDHFNEKQKGAYLISHYRDINKAGMHYEALKPDGNRYLYEISKEEDLHKIRIAAGQPAGYKIYAALLPEEWKPADLLAGKVKRYIEQKLKWAPGRNDTVKTNLSLQFGELMLTLRFRIHEVKIPLSDIERL